MAFGEKNKQVTLTTMIGKDCILEGKLRLKEGIRIDGIVRADIETEGFMSITESAEVTGNLKAHEILISGKVNGNVIALQTLELEKSAIVRGDVNTQNLKIHLGAQINGKMNMAIESSVTDRAESENEQA
jgi:cytoskeletal protein CcmA (bactofilin family)